MVSPNSFLVYLCGISVISLCYSENAFQKFFSIISAPLYGFLTRTSALLFPLLHLLSFFRSKVLLEFIFSFRIAILRKVFGVFLLMDIYVHTGEFTARNYSKELNISFSITQACFTVTENLYEGCAVNCK